LHESIARWADVPPDLRSPCDEPKVKAALEVADKQWPWDARQETLVEREVILPVPGAFGTADLLIVLEDRLVVADWKFGARVRVEVEGNDQLLYYAAASMHTYPRLRRPTVELAIIQGDLSACTVPVEAVDIWLVRYRQALARNTFERGDWCRWCPVGDAGQCPAPLDTEILGSLLA